MRHVLILGAVLLAGSAYAADTIEQGTFAGDKPRGQSVSANAEFYREAGSNFGQSWAEPRTEEPHGTPGNGSEVANDVQSHLADNPNAVQNTVGYGRNK